MAARAESRLPGEGSGDYDPVATHFLGLIERGIYSGKEGIHGVSVLWKTRDSHADGEVEVDGAL